MRRCCVVERSVRTRRNTSGSKHHPVDALSNALLQSWRDMVNGMEQTSASLPSPSERRGLPRHGTTPTLQAARFPRFDPDPRDSSSTNGISVKRQVSLLGKHVGGDGSCQRRSRAYAEGPMHCEDAFSEGLSSKTRDFHHLYDQRRCISSREAS